MLRRLASSVLRWGLAGILGAMSLLGANCTKSSAFIMPGSAAGGAAKAVGLPANTRLL